MKSDYTRAILRMPINLWEKGLATEEERYEAYCNAADELDRLQAIVDQLIHAGNAMPRKTLFAGGSGDEFQYTIVSGAIWDFDKAMTAAEKARTP